MIQFPDVIVNHLLQLASDLDNCSWKLGDTAAGLVDELSTLYSKAEIRQSIAVSCGLSIETVRDREWVARHIPESKRHYPLSFHQYKACLGGGEGWEALAERALESADEYNGRPAPVSVIRGWLRGEGGLVWEKRLEHMLDLADMILRDKDTPDDTLSRCAQVLWIFGREDTVEKAVEARGDGRNI